MATRKKVSRKRVREKVQPVHVEQERIGSKIEKIPLGMMRVNPRAQRDFREQHALKLLAKFDLEDLGVPVVNLRDGFYWLCDGQHRVHALKLFLGDGWETQKIDCQVHTGLTETQEAEKFLRLNFNRPVSAYSLFNVGLTAARETQSAVAAMCEKRGIAIVHQLAGAGGSDAATSAVAALMKAYDRFGHDNFGRALNVLRDSLGTQGLKGPFVSAMTKVCARYSTTLNDKHMTERLGIVRGGISAINNRASLLMRQLGQPKTECIAGAFIETYNAGLTRGKKLPDWWKIEEEETA